MRGSAGLARRRRSLGSLGRTLVVASTAALFLLVPASIALADDTCAPENKSDCRNTAVVIGTAATATVVLTVTIVVLTQEAGRWTPFRCAETLEDLDHDLDAAIAKLRQFVDTRYRVMEVLASAPTPQVAQDVSLLNSRIEEQVLAIDDLYGRRVAVFRACRSKLEGSWQRPPPGIQRGDGGHVTYVEPQRSPHPAREGLGRARRILEREGGGSATIDPVVLTQDLTDLLGTKVPEKWRAVASFFGGPDEVSFVQGPGGVDVNVTRNFPVIPPSIRGGLSDLGSTFGVGGVEQASGPQTAGVRLSVRDGKVAASVTAWPSVAGRLGLDSAKAAKELENALRALNKELDRRGLQVTGISVEGGKLQITSAPT